MRTFARNGLIIIKRKKKWKKKKIHTSKQKSNEIVFKIHETINTRGGV